MAATESMATSVAVSAEPTKPEKLAKVEKPDEEKYKKDLSEADKELSFLNEKLVVSPETALM